MTIYVTTSSKARRKWRRILVEARVGSSTVIIHRGLPTAVVIPYEDYLALEEDLDDLRAARRAEAAIREWELDPSTARDWDEIEADMVRDGVWGPTEAPETTKPDD